MTQELKEGQIVGIVSPDKFKGCRLDVDLVKVPAEGLKVSRNKGVQRTFPELAPVLYRETVKKP